MQAESDGFFALKNYKDSAWEMSLKATGANNVELYYDNSKKLETTSYGIVSNGYFNIAGSGTRYGYTGGDGVKVSLGDSNDLQLYHDGSNSYLKNSTNTLVCLTSGLSINNTANTESLAQFYGNGAVQLFYDGSTNPTFETTTYGAKVGGQLNLYHQSSDSYIKNDSGNLHIGTDGGTYIYGGKDFGEYCAKFINDGAVNLYFDGGTDPKFSTTSTGVSCNGEIQAHTTSARAAMFDRTGSAGTLQVFNFQGSLAGSISVDTGSAAYNTSSDYRLKENEVAISDGITRLKTLKPYRFNFKTDTSKTVDGFFAHEVTAVPEAITGEKDGTEMQGMDYGRLTPLLTAALKEAIAKIETLEAKVAALEAG